jgi:hypothetical protein
VAVIPKTAFPPYERLRHLPDQFTLVIPQAAVSEGQQLTVCMDHTYACYVPVANLKTYPSEGVEALEVNVRHIRVCHTPFPSPCLNADNELLAAATALALTDPFAPAAFTWLMPFPSTLSRRRGLGPKHHLLLFVFGGLAKPAAIVHVVDQQLLVHGGTWRKMVCAPLQYLPAGFAYFADSSFRSRYGREIVDFR